MKNDDENMKMNTAEGGVLDREVVQSVQFVIYANYERVLVLSIETLPLS